MFGLFAGLSALITAAIGLGMALNSGGGSTTIVEDDSAECRARLVRARTKLLRSLQALDQSQMQLGEVCRKATQYQGVFADSSLALGCAGSSALLDVTSSDVQAKFEVLMQQLERTDEVESLVDEHCSELQRWTQILVQAAQSMEQLMVLYRQEPADKQYLMASMRMVLSANALVAGLVPVFEPYDDPDLPQLRLNYSFTQLMDELKHSIEGMKQLFAACAQSLPEVLLSYKFDLADLEAECADSIAIDYVAGVKPRIDPQFFTKGQELLTQLEQVSQLEPDDPEDLGEALQALSQLQQVVDALGEWIELMPRDLEEFDELRDELQEIYQELAQVREFATSGDFEL